MMRHARRALVLSVATLLGGGLMSIPASQAATTDLTSVAKADTYVTPLNPADSFGTAAITRIDDDGRVGYYKFDVPAAPAGMEIASAVFSVKTTSGPALSVNVHSLGNTWGEGTTWNDKPALGGLIGSVVVGSGDTLSMAIPASTLTAGGTQSLALARTVAGNPQEFATRENGTAGNRPKLVVTYQDTVVAPPAKPNLTPSTPGANGDNLMQNIKAGDAVKFNGNWTVADAPTTGSVRVDWYIDDVWAANAAYTLDGGPGGVPVGTYGSLSQTAWTATAGPHVLKMVMDVLNTVDESNEADNTSTRSFTVATVTPPPGNNPPVVSAGADATVKLPATAALDGTVTDDGSFTVAWTKASGPGTVTFGNAAAVDTTASFSVDGAYVLRLTANDGVNPAVSDDVAITVQPADVTPPPTSGLPYTAGSFFKSIVTGAPIDAALTTKFQDFMAQHPDQTGINYPKVNLNPGWSGHNWISASGDPIWKLTGTGAGISDSRLDVLKNQGVHLADATWSTVPTGTQDRLLVVRDGIYGYTMQCADVAVVSSTARTFSASNCGVFWHTSNGLDYRNPASDDSRNFSSRGRIPDAMQVPRSEIDAAVTAGTGLGHVMQMFFVATCGADGFVHPMVGGENKTCWPGDPTGGIFAEGTRLRIKPSVDLPSRGLTGAALVIARTLQQNGTYIGDNSGSASQLKIGPPEAYTGTNLTTNVFSGKISWADFEVIQPGWQ